MNMIEKEILDVFFDRLEADKKISQTKINLIKSKMMNGTFSAENLRKILSDVEIAKTK